MVCVCTRGIRFENSTLYCRAEGRARQLVLEGEPDLHEICKLATAFSCCVVCARRNAICSISGAVAFGLLRRRRCSVGPGLGWTCQRHAGQDWEGGFQNGQGPFGRSGSDLSWAFVPNKNRAHLPFVLNPGKLVSSDNWSGTLATAINSHTVALAVGWPRGLEKARRGRLRLLR